VITKPPSAELRHDQTDQDSLPPYDVLDAILQGLVEKDLSARELVAQGQDPAVVRMVSNLLDLAEYKRRQAPPGVKITRKAFGRDRRYPITNAFRKVGLGGQGRDRERLDKAAERAAAPPRPPASPR
jgi:NAD+ synthase